MEGMDISIVCDETKRSYYVMGEVFKNTIAPEINLYLPEKFNFNSAVLAHYDSVDLF